MADSYKTPTTEAELRRLLEKQNKRLEEMLESIRKKPYKAQNQHCSESHG